MVNTLYEDFQCAGVGDNEMTDFLPVVTAVKQGC